MASAFLAISTNSGELLEALELAISTVGDFSPLWVSLPRPMVERGIRMYESHGFGQWQGYEHEPTYEAVKSAMFDRDLSYDDLCRWDAEGDGAHSTSTADEVLHPSLTNALDPYFFLEHTALSAEIGTMVPWASDVELGGVGPEWGGSEPYPGRSLTDIDDVFLEDLRALLSAYAAQVAGAIDGTTVGLTKGDVLDRIAGFS